MAQKLAWSSPELIELGSVENLTQAGADCDLTKGFGSGDGIISMIIRMFPGS